MVGIFVFSLFIVFLILLDIIVFNRHPKEIKFKEAAFWSAFWILLAVVFGIGVNIKMGHKATLEYFTCYLIEKALSVDNIFVFIILFKYFNVEEKFHQRILLFGVLGAIVFRAIFILLGVALIKKFEWVLYIFGLLLIYTAYKLLKKDEFDPKKSMIIKFAEKHLPYKNTDYFFVRENGKLYLAKLSLVVITVELSDIMFAIDSVPAAFGVTLDEFIIYTSNILAILGLRALYFLLKGLLIRLKYFDIGVSIILGFIGLKMLLREFFHVPVHISLGFVISVLLISAVASIRKR
ncbi:MAG: TerC/Alx family metal homeostasis membrane protein [bacterium]|nr:TerC/Alx family metal homeostasis membrane protein [bacterium]